MSQCLDHPLVLLEATEVEYRMQDLVEEDPGSDLRRAPLREDDYSLSVVMLSQHLLVVHEDDAVTERTDLEDTRKIASEVNLGTRERSHSSLA